jgi:hypothetical protein
VRRFGAIMRRGTSRAAPNVMRYVRIRIVQFALVGGAIIAAECVHSRDDVTAECMSKQRSAWADEQSAAAAAYEPCKLTSLIAYEWTSMINSDMNIAA